MIICKSAQMKNVLLNISLKNQVKLQFENSLPDKGKYSFCVKKYTLKLTTMTFLISSMLEMMIRVCTVRLFAFSHEKIYGIILTKKIYQRTLMKRSLTKTKNYRIVCIYEIQK